jgi:hypothetical protein
MLVLPAIEHANAAPTGELRICKVSDLQTITRQGSELGLAVATMGWNPGRTTLDWQRRPNSRHPFIAQAMYKLVDGRLLQIGIAGVKHGYYVAAADGCGGERCEGPSGQVLHPNCSDTYSASLNADQNQMGPRFEINPWTGAWDPATSELRASHSHGDLEHLLRIQESDLQPSRGTSTKYFIEAYYVHYQNADPNTAVAWERVDAAGAAGGEWSFPPDTAPGSTGQGFALKTVWPGASVSEVAYSSPVQRDTNPDGRALLASRVTSLPSGKWRYDYALLNVDMDRQVSGFRIPLPAGVTVTDVFFHAPKQPDEPRNGVGGTATNDAAWASQLGGNAVSWSTSSNPLRWGVMYNFGFTTDRAPVTGAAVVTLFKSGAALSLQGTTEIPGNLEPTAAPRPASANEDLVSKAQILRENGIALPLSRAIRSQPGRAVTEGGVVELDINQHGDECAAAIGPVPPFSCLDGAIIPITVDGRELPPDGYSAGMACDRPVQLGLGDDGQCVPYARLGTLPSVNAQGQPDPDVKWTYICRRYKLRRDPAYPKFEDVAIIGHRASTGATCFFQTLSGAMRMNDGIQATRVPPPTERAAQTPAGQIKAKDFWLSPRVTAGIDCFQCHDSDPWIHTPYVDQVKGRLGDPTRPLVPDAPRADAPLLYKVVGSQFFTQWQPPHHFAPRNNACVHCHRIGDRQSSGSFTRYAVGVATANVTAMFRTYPHSHWMPPTEEVGDMTHAEWNDFYKQSADQIRSCADDPAQPACKRTATNP